MTSDSRSTPHCVIVGAGLAGLTTAAYLARGGVRVTVVEAASVLGGRLATHGTIDFEHRGRPWSFPREHGLHGFFRQYRNCRRLLRDTGITAARRPVEQQELVFSTDAGALEFTEIGARVRSSGLPSLLALSRAQLDRKIARAHRIAPRDGLRSLGALHLLAFDAERDAAAFDRYSVADFLAGWPRVHARLMRALTRSGSFAEPRETSLAGFLAGMEFYGFGHKSNSAFEVLHTDTERALLAPLATFIEARGGQVLRDTPALRVVDGGGMARAVVVRTADTPVTVAADAVVVAVDPPAYAGLVGRSRLPSLEVPLPNLQACFSTVVARLFFDRDIAPGRAPTGVFGDDSDVADAFFWLHRLQDPFMAWHRETGGAVLECHLYGDRGRWAAGASDEAISARILPLIERVWPRLTSGLVHLDVRRNAPTQVAFGPGTVVGQPTVATPLPNLYRCGDWIASSGWSFHLERAVATGLDAAGQAARHLGCRVLPPEVLAPHGRALSVALAGRSMRAARALGLLPRLRRSA